MSLPKSPPVIGEEGVLRVGTCPPFAGTVHGGRRCRYRSAMPQSLLSIEFVDVSTAQALDAGVVDIAVGDLLRGDRRPFAGFYAASGPALFSTPGCSRRVADRGPGGL
jgi:hypothetical protein